MNAPALILKKLQEHHIEPVYINARTRDELARLQRTPNSSQQVALMLLLETPARPLQVIIPGNTLLELDTLAEHLGTQVTALSVAARQRLLARKGLQNLPAVPALTGHHTLVDCRLAETETLLIESGQPGLLLSLRQRDFQSLTAGCTQVDCCTPLKEVEDGEESTAGSRTALNKAIRRYTSRQLKTRLADPVELPPLSATAQKILELSTEPHADVDDLVKIVALDPALSAQVVGWAASPFYSAPGRVKSIRDAILRVLGFELVLNLSLGLAMSQSLRFRTDGPCAVTDFWRQSVYCALSMETLNRCLPDHKRVEPGLSYLAGLMNNFGYLVLGHVFPSHFKVLCQYRAANPHVSPRYIEQHLLGTTSEELSSQLAAAWNIPQQIHNALRYQHNPYYDGIDAVYANLCYLSKQLLLAADIGQQPAESIPGHLFDALELDPAEAEQVIAELLTCNHEIDDMVSTLAA